MDPVRAEVGQEAQGRELYFWATGEGLCQGGLQRAGLKAMAGLKDGAEAVSQDALSRAQTQMAG